MIHKMVTAAIFVFVAVSISSLAFAQADAIEKRQKLMKSNSAAVKAIKGALEGKDYATVETKAKEIMGNAEKTAELFPKGSHTGKTKASPAIWEKADEFAKAAKKLASASGELASAAKAKDDTAVGVKFKAVGEACSSCHKAFRTEKYAE